MQPLDGEWRRGDMAYYAMMQNMHGGVRNAHAVVSGQPRTESQVYDRRGPGSGHLRQERPSCTGRPCRIYAAVLVIPAPAG